MITKEPEPGFDASRVMQNPGDTRVPPGVGIKPKPRVLILNENAVLTDPSRFDQKVILFANGLPSAKDEAAEFIATGGVVDDTA